MNETPDTTQVTHGYSRGDRVLVRINHVWVPGVVVTRTKKLPPRYLVEGDASWPERFRRPHAGTPVWRGSFPVSDLRDSTDVDCVHVEVPEVACYIRFGAQMLIAKRATRDLGQTCRGETLVADLDDDGRICGIELIGGKPCQSGETAKALQNDPVEWTNETR